MFKFKFLQIFVVFSSFAIAQRTENLGDFTKITAFDKIDVVVEPSSENKIIINGDFKDEVQLVNKNGELKIRMPLEKSFKGDNISVTVFYKKLEALEANEGSRIASNKDINAINFDIIAKEGAEIVLEKLVSERLNVKMHSGALVTVSGTVSNQDIVANSGSKYDGEECSTKTTVVTVNAGGIANVYATEFVNAKTRAGGTITIFGKPKEIEKKTIAGGTISQAD